MNWNKWNPIKWNWKMIWKRLIDAILRAIAWFVTYIVPIILAVILLFLFMAAIASVGMWTERKRGPKCIACRAEQGRNDTDAHEVKLCDKHGQEFIRALKIANAQFYITNSIPKK